MLGSAMALHGTGASAGGLPVASADEAAELRTVVKAVVACVLGESREHPDVEDCAHEALRRAIEGSSRLREGEPLRPWVIGIARHVAIDARRRRRLERRRDEGATAADDEDSGVQRIERVIDPSPGPDEQAALAERAGRVETALASLSDGQRRALVLFHVEGLGYQDIARRLGVPLGTVATWIARARRSLAGAAGEGEGDGA